jgi:DNA recombination protein RmuC
LNLPSWAQSDMFIIMASIIGVLVIILPIITRYFVTQTHRNLMQQAQSEWTQQKNTFENNDALVKQQLESLQLQHQQLQEKFDEEKQAHAQFLQNTQNKSAAQERVIGELSQQSNELLALRQQFENQQTIYAKLQTEFAELQAQQKAQEAAIEQERKAFDEKLILLNNAEKHLNNQFENLANKIFEQKAERFSKTNETGINQLLSPLKSQIDDFKKQISDQYIKEGQERASLKYELTSLKELNLQITQEAAALTNALKGDNKKQGNWGEVVLARILEESGLRSGHEYEVEKHLHNEEGKAYRPDVVVHLPNEKDVVIDSKVSLVAHEKVVNAENDDLRKQALREHINSIKLHIKGLSSKDYQELEGVKTLDYVLMFIPIESAFINAVEHDPSIVKLAMDNQIMLVSPTNLLVALRTINNIWQYEYQNQNAKLIADRAKKMYDKFAGFIDDMQRIGKNIETLNNNYEGAMNKLSTGRGNLVRQVESFKKLGVTPTKSINKNLVDADGAEEADDAEAAEAAEAVEAAEAAEADGADAVDRDY